MTEATAHEIQATQTRSVRSLAPVAWGLPIFLSAALLFQVEPILAKMILPWFGGASSVWTACLTFFQVTYLLGNLYAHWLIRRGSGRLPQMIHLALLGASLFLLPIVPQTFWKPAGDADPTWRILGLLTVTIGLPFFLLSATSPLLQRWYVQQRSNARPYRFYALSNLGSLLGLLSYPVLIEPYLTTHHQAVGWSWVYAGFTVLCAGLTARQSRAPMDSSIAKVRGTLAPDWKIQLLWVLLAADASALLLSVTSYISQNVAPIPLLWVVPLSLYLLSLILCFEERGWYSRPVFLRLAVIFPLGMAYATSSSFSNASLFVQVSLFCAGLFVCCMFCHGELAALKPDPDRLTLFYLMVAAGGALGGIFVGVVAPHVFRGLYELPISLGLFGILLPVAFPQATLRARLQFSLFLAIVIGGFMVSRMWLRVGTARLIVRNFYGALRVDDLPASRTFPAQRQLTNGAIFHGTELAAPDRHMQPTAYYGVNSGAGLALTTARQRGSLRVGVVGLGAGTLASYGRPGDHYTFYEINPLVIELASTQFDFLRESGAQIEIVPGDARLSLEREAPRDFDVLLVDAFSGDAIPIHLLTREAFELYTRHLGPDGWLLIHISNHFIDLQPVVDAAAQPLGFQSTVVGNLTDLSNAIEASQWMFLRRASNSSPAPNFPASEVLPASVRKIRPWTDDYSNLLHVMK